MIGLRRRRAAEEAIPDLMPLAGLLLVILVFFVINLNFVREPLVETRRPERPRRGPAIFLAVSSAGTVHLGGARVDLSAIRPAVSRLLVASPGTQVMVVADDSARASLVARVVDECRLAGAEDIAFSVRGEGGRHGS